MKPIYCMFSFFGGRGGVEQGGGGGGDSGPNVGLFDI